MSFAKIWQIFLVCSYQNGSLIHFCYSFHQMVLVGAFTVSDILYLHSEVLCFQYKTVQETF